MSKYNNVKRKSLQPEPEQRSPSQTSSRSLPTVIDNIALDEHQVNLLTLWLDDLNRDQLITITAQNDIVIMAGGENDESQQIFINNEDIDAYMVSKKGKSKMMERADVIGMSDIARILIKYRYVDGSSGQLSFRTQTLLPESDELMWLRSIVYSARPDPQSMETHVNLFDGENKQSMSIPHQYMAPTDDPRAVATYLFQNGHVRYNVDTGTYGYRYIEPDILLGEKTKSAEHIRQRQSLSFHIRQIYVDKQRKRVELEFLQDSAHRLVLPASWYHQVEAHHFDRNYITDILLSNGGVIDRDSFVFMDHAYPLQVSHIAASSSTVALAKSLRNVNLSQKQKNDLIQRFVDLIIEQDGTKHDNTSRLVLLENPTDGRRLYFTPEHSGLIRQNHFKRQDVIYLLIDHGQIKEDGSGNWVLYYNNQYIQLPPSLIPRSKAAPQRKSNTLRALFERFFLGIEQDSRPTTAPVNRTQTKSNVRPVQGPQAKSPEWYHNTINYMYQHGLVTWDKRAKLINLQFADQTLRIPINHLRSIVDSRAISSPHSVGDGLPFSSRQLSQWLMNNSYMTPNTR